jgi:sugar lactone lactonase YvrE
MIALPSAAMAVPGDLTYQGCIAEAGAGGCVDPSIDSLDDVRALAVSADGNNVYTASGTDRAVTSLTRAADGSLGFLGCTADAGMSGCTDPANDTLQNVNSVAISPDGADVYAMALSSASVSHFDRDPATGALTLADCVSNGGLHGCVSAPIGTFASGSDVTVSPDGNNVYVVASNTITNLSRGAGGQLTWVNCISPSMFGIAACAHPPNDSLRGAEQITVSPDGASAYVTSSPDMAARITTLSRDPATGTLTWVGCNANAFAGCDTSGLQALNGVDGVVVTPDNSTVYVASSFADAVVRFARNPATGVLSFGSCVAEAGANGCGDPPTDSLDGVSAIALGPGAADLYVAAGIDRSLTHLRTVAAGAPTFSNCVADFGASGCADPPTDSMNTSFAVAATADGKNVYSVAPSSDAVNSFAVEPTPPVIPPPDPTDTTPPETTIEKGPKKKSTKRKAKFSFSSSEPGSTFECALDKKSFAPCSSPTKVKKLKPKKHKFQVRAIDAAGNPDLTAAVKKFKVLQKK